VVHDSEGRSEGGALITAVFPTYNAGGAVAGLVASLRSQEAPAGAPPERWLEVIFIDNASTDDTVERIEAELAAANLPFHVRVIRNEENLGLSRSFNRALEAVATKYVLTCHADCRFGSDDYVARVVALLDGHPDVAVVSGQPIADVSGGLSRVEKVYLTANLMDIFPEGDGDLEPVGFAEGRCDGFRMEALRDVGYYDTRLQRAGEDQIMSARLRALGHRVCRAPQLRYFLSVSSDQDSLLKLVRHANLFGRVTPYLLLADRGTLRGIAGPVAGRNRTRRTALRALQLAGAGSMLWIAGSLWTRRSPGPACTALVVTSVAKAALFRRYVRYLGFDVTDAAALAVLQPALDVAYAAGVARGLVVGGGARTNG
jgi:glycosyltransferase involved in cell wall biosynthesis